MKLRGILFFAGLFLLSSMSFASTNVYTISGKLEGTAVAGSETEFKINYKWLNNHARSGKVFYNVVGTDCKGSVDIDKHSALLPVAGELYVKCIFNKSAVFRSDTVLQLYDGSTKKEISNHETGAVIVIAK